MHVSYPRESVPTTFCKHPYNQWDVKKTFKERGDVLCEQSLILIPPTQDNLISFTESKQDKKNKQYSKKNKSDFYNRH